MLSREQFAATLMESLDEYLVGKDDHQRLLAHDAAQRARIEEYANCINTLHLEEKNWKIAIAELEQQLAARDAHLARLAGAVTGGSRALKAWLHTYASELCEEKEVEIYKQLIQDEGGTLAYIAKVLDVNQQALAQGKEEA